MNVDQRSERGHVTDAVAMRPRRDLTFWGAIFWLALLSAATILAAVLPLADPNDIDLDSRLARPFQQGHLLGSDELGRDLLARVVYGARVSLGISILAVLLGLTVGALIGLVTGYVRGWTDRVVMPIMDVLLAFPPLVILLAFAAIVGRSVSGLIVVLGLIAVPSSARIVRANTLTVSKRGWVRAARAEGAGHSRIVFREVLPSVVPQLAAMGLLGVGVYIVVEGGLSFLGLSVPAPTPTWGGMIFESQKTRNESLWPMVVPAVVLFVTVLALNFVGDSLRSRFDVRDAAL